MCSWIAFWKKDWINRFAQPRAMASGHKSWASAHGMDPLAPKDTVQKTVFSTIQEHQRSGYCRLNKFLQTKGMRIANGYGD
jgi:hypothetical protein